jgi:uridine kinase
VTQEIVLSQLADAIVFLQRSHPLLVAIDGVFLLCPELNALWDYRLFVHVDFEVALQRAMVRDEELL